MKKSEFKKIVEDTGMFDEAMKILSEECPCIHSYTQIMGIIADEVMQDHTATALYLLTQIDELNMSYDDYIFYDPEIVDYWNSNDYETSLFLINDEEDLEEAEDIYNKYYENPMFDPEDADMLAGLLVLTELLVLGQRPGTGKSKAAEVITKEEALQRIKTIKSKLEE